MRGKPNDFGINKVNDSLTLIIVGMCFIKHNPTTKHQSNVDLALSRVAHVHFNIPKNNYDQNSLS